MKYLAVAMSLYKLDTEEYIKRAVDSLLIQNVDFDLFIQVDGLVDERIKCTLDYYNKNDNVFVFYNSSNLGLATRLNQCIDLALQGNYKYLARMDADDICSENRFEKQLQFLNENEDISVVGSDVIEISEIGEEVFYKKMDNDHYKISERIIKKCPFNHPSVMFRMEVFKLGFRYKHELKNTQDFYLWVDLLAAGKKFANINEPLLKFRVNDSFHSRRGFDKAINEFRSRIYAFRKLDILTVSNVIHTISLFLLRLSPVFVKKVAYRYFR